MSCGSRTSTRRLCTTRSFCWPLLFGVSRMRSRMFEKKTPISDLRWSLKKRIRVTKMSRESWRIDAIGETPAREEWGRG